MGAAPAGRCVQGAMPERRFDPDLTEKDVLRDVRQEGPCLLAKRSRMSVLCTGKRVVILICEGIGVGVGDLLMGSQSIGAKSDEG